jgi:3-oxoacyl-[acyl-carrier protein] reductase
MKKAIVLGGTRGIGGAIANSLNDCGLQVNAFSSKSVDTGNLQHIDALVAKHPEADVLVLNTGGPPAIDFFDINQETWEKYHNQLFLGFCKLLQSIHLKDNGYVFLVSSFNIKEPDPKLLLSNCYRLAFVSVFKSLSKLFANRKISFINIAPGPIDTDRLTSLGVNIEELGKKLPMGYVANASEIGDFVASIVEKQINYLSGVTINFDGAAGNYVL